MEKPFKTSTANITIKETLIALNPAFDILKKHFGKLLRVYPDKSIKLAKQIEILILKMGRIYLLTVC